MKRFLLFCVLLCDVMVGVAGTYRIEEIPNVQQQNRERYVSNPDGILSSETVSHLDLLCASLRERGLAQVAIVAVDDIADDDVFDFAIRLFRHWGVGNAKNNNGLGILLVKNRREIRFVTGDGLEGVLPDALCKRIQMEYMLPAFRREDYNLGMETGVEAAVRLIEGGELTPVADQNINAPTGMILLVIVAGMMLVFFMIARAQREQRRCPQCGKLTLVMQSRKILRVTRNYRDVEVTYVCSHCGNVVRRLTRNLRDDNFGGGIGGGTIIGGFGGRGFGGGSFGGGFGGGSFGGGGAGSRW